VPKQEGDEVTHVPFEALPDHGRLWVFPASRTLTAEELAALGQEVDDFLASWRAHGAPLRAGREVVEDRFLLVGVDVDAESPSGCSIDALLNRLRALGTARGVTLIDHAAVLWRDGDQIRSATRTEFRALAAIGTVTPDTAVFDTSLTRVDQARGGALERPASETWHARAFFKDRVGS
jgi:hypothetical protein